MIERAELPVQINSTLKTFLATDLIHVRVLPASMVAIGKL